MTAGSGQTEMFARLVAAQELLYLEARLLDERRFDAWLELFTDDAVYSLPIAISDDRREPALIKDSRARMEERIFRLTKTLAHAQNPPSRTQHHVSNIEVQSREDGLVEILCNQTVHELRGGDALQVGLAKHRVFAARCRYLILPEDSWRIKKKTCNLIDREYPMYNLTFIF